MGLGAIIKIGLDSTAVKRGLAGIRKSFALLSKSFKGIMGLGRKALGLPGLIAGTLIAKGTVDLVKYGNELKGVAAQTGLTIKEILQLRNAMTLAGMKTDEAADFLSDFQEKIADAKKTGGGTAAEGLWDLGMIPQDFDFKLKTAGENFEIFMRAVEKSKATPGEKGYILDKLFGGVGFELNRLASDYDKFMAMGQRNTAGLADTLDDELIGNLETATDAMSRLGIEMKRIGLTIISKLPWDAIRDLLDGIDASKISAGINGLFTNFGASLEAAMEWISAKAGEIGSTIGSAIGNAIKDALQSLIPGGGIIKTIGRLGQASTPGPTGTRGAGGLMSIFGKRNDAIEGLLKDQNKTLNLIERKEGAIWQ